MRFAALIAMSLPRSVALLAQTATPTPGAVVADQVRDARTPAASIGVRIPSGGVQINGYLMQASGPAPHPTVLLLHGFPGYEGMLDVGEAIRRAGFDVLAFHYRGSWGSDGQFSFAGSIDDALAALAWLREPANAARFRVDTSRIYAVGHSMGGFMAVMAAARTHDLKGLVYLSGWDIGSEVATWRGAPSAAVLADYRESASRVQGATGDALVAEMLAHQHEWSLATVAPRIADRPILMTVARHEEEDNPPAVNHEPLLRALRSAGAKRLETQWFETDHAYSDTRIALASAVVQWLNHVAAYRAPS
jgi:pimeloyl-ACP methyl ester carboxylesterase